MQWPESQLINNIDTTSQALASCWFALPGYPGQLFLFWKSSSSNQIFFSPAGPFTQNYGWSAGRLINGTDSTPQAPAACVFNNQLFLFWVANDPSNRIWFSASGTGTAWPPGQLINGTDSTPLTPSACVFNGKLFLFWKSNSSNQIFFSSSADGATWPPGELINGTDATPLSPAACVFNGKLFLFWKSNSSNQIFFSSSADGTTWPQGQVINDTDSTPQAPAACVFNNQLFLFWVANDGTNKIWFSASGTGTAWPPGQLINGTDSTPLPISAAVGTSYTNLASPNPSNTSGQGIFLFWKSNSSESIFFNASGVGVFQNYTEAFFEFWTTNDDLRQDSTLTGTLWGLNPSNVPSATESFSRTGTLTIKPFNAPKFDNGSYNNETVQLSPGLTPIQLALCTLTLVQGGSGLFESSDEWHVGGIQISLVNPNAGSSGYFVYGPLPVGDYASTAWVLNQANPTISLNLYLSGPTSAF